MSTTQPDDFDALKTISQALEGFPLADQARILRWISEKLGVVSAVQSPPLALSSTTAPVVAPVTPTPPGTVSPPAGRSVDIKSYVTSKQPKNDTQFAAVVAYYYRFEAPEPKNAISQDDLQASCRLVGRERLAQPTQTLRNAKNAGLLDAADRGTYSINTVGENLVAVTLPGDGTPGAKNARRKPVAKRRAAVTQAAKKNPRAKAIPKNLPTNKK